MYNLNRKVLSQNFSTDEDCEENRAGYGQAAVGYVWRRGRTQPLRLHSLDRAQDQHIKFFVMNLRVSHDSSCAIDRH